MGAKKELDKLSRLVARQGWVRKTTGGGHYKFVAPTGRFLFTSVTPSDFRSVRNIKAQMIEMGADFTPRKGRKKEGTDEEVGGGDQSHLPDRDGGRLDTRV